VIGQRYVDVALHDCNRQLWDYSPKALLRRKPGNLSKASTHFWSSWKTFPLVNWCSYVKNFGFYGDNLFGSIAYNKAFGLLVLCQFLIFTIYILVLAGSWQLRVIASRVLYAAIPTDTAVFFSPKVGLGIAEITNAELIIVVNFVCTIWMQKFRLVISSNGCDICAQ